MLLFFNDTATTEICTLALHDALPIYFLEVPPGRFGDRSASAFAAGQGDGGDAVIGDHALDRARADRQILEQALGRGAARRSKSTRLNSSHANISYAVFCLKKKNNPCP